jgi:uncharacterized protein YggE
MKMRRALMLSLQLLPGLAAAQGPVQRPVPEISTSGTAEARLPADRVLVGFSVQTGASTAAGAASRNGEIARRVQAAVQDLGYRGNDVRATAFGVAPNYDYRNGRRLVDYQARTHLEVTVRDFDRLGSLIDAALGAGATDVGSMRFVSDTSERARLGLVRTAFENARAEAAALAAAAGGRLGPVLSVTTTPQFTPYGDVVATARIEAGAAEPGAPNVQREVIVTARVQVRWAFEP